MAPSILSQLGRLLRGRRRPSRPSGGAEAETPRYEDRPGTVDGRHYTAYVGQVRDLKREGRLGEAEALLLRLLDAVEAEAAAKGYGVAPWYYEQLAIIYRKQKRYRDEVDVLTRYMSQPHAPGVGPHKLAARLARAQSLLRQAATKGGKGNGDQGAVSAD